mgnify:CR=1 FL=1
MAFLRFTFTGFLVSVRTVADMFRLVLNVFSLFCGQERNFMFKRFLAGFLCAALVLTPVASSVGTVFVKTAGDENVYAAESIEASKVASLSFEDNLTDSTGNGNDGTITGTENYVEGVSGKALYLNGSSYVDLGTSGTLQPENLTVSMWVCADGTMSGEEMLVWFKPSGNYQGKGWYLSSLDDSTPLKISIGESTGQPMEAYVSASRSEFFPDGEWVHIVVTFNSEDQTVAIYRNGIAQEVLYLNTASYITSDSTSNKYIGFNSPGYNGGYCKLSLDEFEIYSTAASASDVLTLYANAGGSVDGEDIVNADYDSLKFSITNVTQDITLATEGTAGSTITWASSDESVIGTDGTVNRPLESEGDKTVTLTATITYGDSSVKKEFEFTVLSQYEFDGVTAFDLSDVELLDEFEIEAYEADVEYLKSLSCDRLLKGFLTQAGLTSTASLYGGWESTAIMGHTLGHYLSAISTAYAYSQDEELKERIDYIVSQLAACQQSSGYLMAIPESHFDQLEDGNTSGIWVPYYNMHKLLAGLVSAYEYGGNEEALTVATKLADWVYNRVMSWDSTTQATVLSIEYGGMNDVLYEIYALTGNSKYADAAHMFDEMTLFDKLYAGEDCLNGLHANTTIPKILGALNRYYVMGETEDEEYYLTVAKNFFSIVTTHHTYITGGNSEWEHFGESDVLDAERTNCNCETCNVYNMLKLARLLFEITGDSTYSDYYEQALLNDILASQDSETGLTTYFQSMATGYFKVYSSAENSFWCCTGTGMENFTKLMDSIYFKNDSELYVNQFISSKLTYTEKGLVLTQESSVITGGETTTLTISAKSGSTDGFDLMIRVPDWLASDMEITLNGEAVSYTVTHGYAKISGPFNDGDVITITTPMEVVAYNLPDGENTLAFKYGPIVLAADLGNENMTTTTTGVSVTIPQLSSAVTKVINTSADSIEEFMENISQYLVKGEGLSFSLSGTDADSLVFSPYYLFTDDSRYGIYFKVTSGSYTETDEEKEAEEEAALFAANTIDSVPVSNDQYELAHNLVSDNSTTGSYGGLMYRDALSGGSFTYTFKVDSKNKNYLVVKYTTADDGRAFTIYANDEVLCEVTLDSSLAGTSDEENGIIYKEVDENDFYMVWYEIPTSLTNGKESVDIKFAATGSSPAGGIYDTIYIIRDYNASQNSASSSKTAMSGISKLGLFAGIALLIAAVSVGVGLGIYQRKKIKKKKESDNKTE